MDEGFILSNKFRRAVFAELVSGETDIERIAKKHHIIRNVAMRIADDFIREEIIEKKGNRYFLTNDGEKLAANIK
jgi:predicted transcriptional regulator